MTQHPGLPAASPARRSALASIARWLRRNEPLRRSLQTVAAVAIAYVAAVVLRLPDPSWAVFSALFVVQDSVGGTVTSAVNRVLGAVLGLALGVAALLAIGSGEWRGLVALILAVAAMTWIAAQWPQTRYGLVTAALVIIAPAEALLKDLVLTALTIALGAVCGAAAGALVLPVAAHRSALVHLGRATAACGSLLAAGMEALERAQPPELRAVHAEIEQELDRARDMISQSRYHRRGARHVPAQMELLRHVDRLWYTLALVDRLSARRLPRDVSQVIGPVQRATSAYRQFLQQLGEAIRRGESLEVPPPREHDDIMVVIDALRRQEELVREIGREEAEGLFTLAFAWEQVQESVGALAECVGRREG